ncbi:GAF and ANTAR domain-containing protein [Nakamurella endophytica]|uniref:Transcriptional regulator n=1 Tax=Nakamurella endophytica TaxID=1748367 RepID=A0A917T7P3_9ACTN|nr:GAF and ANTAR domain-containing protein [Nakamurella endophytica]GGM13751.1 transcriptional regulator [Nakamurella endophytica]
MSDDRRFSEMIATVARDLAAEPDLQHTLQRVVDLAAEHLGNDAYVGVSIVHKRGRVDTPASSDDRAARADQLQYELGEGPCLDAIWERETFGIGDLLHEDRYPRWAHRVAEETGIRSSLSFQLFTSEDTLGALNVYSPHPAGFADRGREEGQVFAAQAAIALQSARTEDNLRTALATRTLIGQAQGILMERYRMTADQAFDVLRLASQRSNVLLRDVADRLVQTGETPAVEPSD